MKNDFALALKQVLDERGLPQDVVLAAIEDAMVSAYRRAVHASTAQHVEAKIDPITGAVSISAEKEVVDEVQDDRTEVILAEAKQVNPEAEYGDMVVVESTPSDFGRVAAQTARQVIQQRIREAERDAQHAYYANQAGDIVSGVVHAINAKQISLGLDLKAEGVMPRRHQIPREFFRVHDRVRALLLEVQDTNRGPKIILSRAHPDFLRRLLENEVPEIYQGLVEIRSISREPGQRSKVAVTALQPGVDPVGACVGIRGVRIQTIVRELSDEKIDVIEWNSDPEAYIAKALSPARVLSVFLEEHDGPKTATVVVPEDQLSLAIGRDGQNARLTAKLTGWRIDIKSLIEATSETLFKLKNNAAYADYQDIESEHIPRIEALMKKKAEGRPITPEDFQEMHLFTTRIERGLINSTRERKQAYASRLKTARKNIPAGAYELPLLTLGFSDHLTSLLEDNLEVSNVGELMFAYNFDPGAIREIDGIGPKAMEEIEAALNIMTTSLAPVEIAEKSPAKEVDETISAGEMKTETVTPEEVGEATKELPEQEMPAEIEDSVEEVAIDEVESSEAVVEEAAKAEAPAEKASVPEEELPKSMEEIFKLKPEMLDFDEFSSDETLDDKGKKRKKYVEIEYDPDRDVTIYRKKRKKSGQEWDEWNDDEWDF